VTSLLLPLAWILFLSAGAWAQSGTSSVHGTVLDPQGRVVTGATVSLTSAERNFFRTQKSNASGGYLFTAVPPGIYRIQTEATGFKTLTIEGVRALVDTPSSVDLQLEIGEISLSVSTTAEEPFINRQDATVGLNFQASQISQLPLESRNVVALLSVQPGVTPDGYVTGSRADQANVTLDGVDVNEQQTGLDVVQNLAFNKTEAFATVLRATPDSVQEFRVTVTNPHASQGRSSGGQVSLITQSGTSELHGSLYEFHRNTVTSANNFFNNRTIDPDTGKSIPRPDLIRNLFGGSVGGPIKKDRVFFFYNYEGRRDAGQQSVVRIAPLESLGRGEIRFLNPAGGVTTLTAEDINRLFPVGINPLGLAVLADAARRYPANDFTVGDSSAALRFNTAGFRFNAPTPLRWNTHIGRLDFNLTPDGKHTLFTRGNYQQDVIGGVRQFPDTPPSTFWNHPSGVAVGHTWSLSSTKVNSFRYGLTREAFSNQGDSSENDISFRFAYEPRLEPAVRTLERITPTHNFIDDFSWVKGNHHLQFGTNIRLIANKRVGFGKSFDEALTNPSLYEFSGDVLNQPIEDAGYSIDPGFRSSVQNAVSAVIGRLSEYTANFNFDKQGDLLPSGTGIGRRFATQEYDWYLQDAWKLRPNLTLTLGLRYGLNRPVYETNGFEVKPSVSLGDYFERRKAAATAGHPLNELIQVDLAGPANGRPGLYDWDKNNLQPRVSVAWSPDFERGFLGKLFGRQGSSVFRGGFAVTNDHIGQQLAVTFDLNNTLGFSSSDQISANTYNVSNRPAPLFTGFNQDVRALPGIAIPGKLTFPLQKPDDESQRIEFTLDDTLRTPIHYSWNVSFGRELPSGIFFEASYIGRFARKLLAQRDIMALNNLVDPKSGTDWYSAIGALTDLRAKNTPIRSVEPIPYFQNLFPATLGGTLVGDAALTPTQAVYTLIARESVDGFNYLDMTYIQLLLDDESVLGRNIFFHPQYGALFTWGTLANSDYHAGTLSVRRQYATGVNWGFNYTLSKSMDNASGLQNSPPYVSSFINPLRPEDMRSYSDFDIRHVINGHGLWEFPVGRGKAFLNQLPGFAEAILGGWQLTGIYRWNSGLPARNIFDAAQWATNWQVQSFGVRTRPIKSSPTRGSDTAPNLFSDPTFAYQSFRNARAGETGDRNALRLPGFVTLDIGLGKSFSMPWSERHKLQFRWEVFNLTNTQRLRTSPDGYTRDSYGLAIDPDLGEPAPSFGNFDSIQGTPRVMQFGLRYTW
jgi:hypothetical protein